MKLRYTLFLTALLAAGPAQAATLVVHGGKLLGADDIDVAGKKYDLRFVEGTCAQVFSGCDAASDFDFQSFADASAAAQALIDQVWIDGPTGAFDTRPELTFGCSALWGCTPLIPHDPSGLMPDSVRVVYPVNAPIDPYDFVNYADQFFKSIDTSGGDSRVYAKFTLSAVPEPATWALMIAGFGLIGGAMRRQRARVRFGAAHAHSSFRGGTA